MLSGVLRGLRAPCDMLQRPVGGYSTFPEVCQATAQPAVVTLLLSPSISNQPGLAFGPLCVPIWFILYTGLIGVSLTSASRWKSVQALFQEG
jgi:hypothetical protein